MINLKLLQGKITFYFYHSSTLIHNLHFFLCKIMFSVIAMSYSINHLSPILFQYISFRIPPKFSLSHLLLRHHLTSCFFIGVTFIFARITSFLILSFLVCSRIYPNILPPFRKIRVKYIKLIKKHTHNTKHTNILYIYI